MEAVPWGTAAAGVFSLTDQKSVIQSKFHNWTKSCLSQDLSVKHLAPCVGMGEKAKGFPLTATVSRVALADGKQKAGHIRWGQQHLAQQGEEKAKTGLGLLSERLPNWCGFNHIAWEWREVWQKPATRACSRATAVSARWCRQLCFPVALCNNCEGSPQNMSTFGWPSNTKWNTCMQDKFMDMSTS